MGADLLEGDVGVNNEVVVGICSQLVGAGVAIWIQRRATPYIVPQIVLTHNLDHFSLLGLLVECLAFQHGAGIPLAIKQCNQCHHCHVESNAFLYRIVVLDV